MWAVANGWHVFPSNGKVPVLTDWERRASVEAAQVADWFMDTRGYNVAIACGPSGLVVVDEDRPGGFKEFANDWGQTIPPTFTVRTGKGRHFYFEQAVTARLDEHVPGRSATYGCDVRGHRRLRRRPRLGASRHRVRATCPRSRRCRSRSCPAWLVAALTGEG